MQLALQHMQIATVLVDDGGIVGQVSPAFEALCGWAERELSGEPFQRLLAEDARAASTACQDDPSVKMCPFRRRDGGTFLGACTVIPLVGDGGTFQGSLWIVRPRSEADRRSEALRALIGLAAEQSEEDHADITRFIDHGCRYFGLELGIFQSTDDARIEAWAGDLCREIETDDVRQDYRFSSMCGDDHQVVTSKDRGVAARLHPADPGQSGQGSRSRDFSFATLLSFPVRGAYRLHGAFHFADRRALGSFDPEAKQILRFMSNWLALRMDARVARQHHEEASRRLQESEERYRTIYEKTPAILHSIDDRGRLASVSDAWLSTMGYVRDEVIGRPSTDFLTPASKRYAEEVVLPAYRASGSCHDIPYQFVTKQGDVRDMMLSAISLSHDDGKFFRSLAVLLDVTEQKRVEQVLARKTTALERSNADLARFAQIASHDLQEPLRRIIGYCEILKEDHGPELSEGAVKIAGIIQSGGWQLRLLINDLLAYIRVKEQLDRAFEPVDMAAVLHHALDDLEGEINSRNVRVNMAQLPLVWGRAPLLKMVFHHLLSNAIKHGTEQVPEIDVAVDDVGDFWRFAVSDQGPGVEPRFADRIFEIFERLHHKDERRGSGTGLAICRMIVQRCGGDIWLDRSYREGARFVFTLPKERPDVVHCPSIDSLARLSAH